MNNKGRSKKVGDVPPGGEEQFHEIFNSVKDAMFIETPEGKILDVNKAACDLLGYTKDELLSMDVAGIVPPDIAARLPKTVRKTTIKKGVYVESESLSKDGRRIPVEVSCTLVKIGGEKRVVSILRDLTEKKTSLAELKRYQERLEELVAQRTAELVESEERFRKIFDNTKDAIFIERPDGSFVDANKAACAMLGYDRDELLKLGIRDVVTPEIAPALPGDFTRDMSHEGIYSERENVRKDGTHIYVEYGSSLVTIGGQKRMISIVRDVTARRKAEEELRKYHDHLERMVQKRAAELIGVNQDLLAEIAKREKIQAELEEKKSDLEKKNVALREVLSQIEQDKEQVKSDVIANVEHLMMPVLRKIKSKATRIEAQYIDMLRHGLGEMVSSFGRKISDKAVKLSPREIEISDMIRNGMSSKEISELLHLTLKTVELQRVNIRRKLGIAHKDINLTTYLQSI